MVRRIKAKLVLELRAEGMTGRAIAFAQGMSRKSVLTVTLAAATPRYMRGCSRAAANTRVCSCSPIGMGCTKSSPKSG
jgi:transposase